MPAQALINSLVERALNSALQADPDAPRRLRAVRGRTFRLTLSELPWPLTLTFCADKVLLMGSEYEAVDGEVITSLPVLAELRDASKVTAAIHRGDLTLHGDPVLAQQASQVIAGLQIDWENVFCEHFGDVPGYWMTQGFRKLRHWLPSVESWKSWLNETVRDEKRLVVGHMEYALYCEDMQALERRVAQLERKE